MSHRVCPPAVTEASSPRGLRQPASLRALSAPFSPARQSTLALGVSAAMLTSAPVWAQEKTAETEMATVTVVERVIDHNPYAEPDAPYKAKISGDERRTRPLAETPATIQVLTKTQIEDSGYTDLRDILDTQPGITLGTGENGNAFGDRYIIRGQEARSDVFVDGLRDPGMSIRESFAVEQVEVSKGPSSSFAGRGTVGGAINSITKQATTDYDFTKLSFGLGTYSQCRVTLDTNYTVTDTLAVRANVLYGYEEVPDRAPADRERKGVALSTRIKPSDNLDVVLDYYGFRGNDTPDLGSYLYGTVPNRKPFANAPVYVQEGDFLTSEVDTLTARVKYRFNDKVRLTNATRYGKSENGYVATGASYATDTSLNLSTHQGWQEVEYFANQTNLFVDTQIAGMKHEFNVGLEYSDHSVLNGVYTMSGTTRVNGVAFSAINGAVSRANLTKGLWDQDWRAQTWSASLMDTVDLSETWTAFAGMRYDRTTISLKTQNTTTGALTGDYGYTEGMWNGHLGLTYKFLPYANVYATYATAQDLNGGESDVGTSSGYGGLIVLNGQAAAKPELTENIELGTKWNLLGGKLLATAAVFEINKKDVMEGNGYTSSGTYNSGGNRVRGIEFGLAGNLTEKLSAFAGVSFMEAEVTKSATQDNVGKTLSNFAENTASAQLRYQATPKFAFGSAVKYESKKYAGQPDSAAGYNANGEYSQPIPAYTVVDVFADYRIDKQTKLRLNIGNVFDKDYYLAGYRSGSFLYKGDARNARLTLNYDF
ncbi:MAG: TonB-dependent receptor [Azonexus sp.]|nr:TonB-dependent receptor [Azonexus sp.]